MEYDDWVVTCEMRKSNKICLNENCRAKMVHVLDGKVGAYTCITCGLEAYYKDGELKTLRWAAVRNKKR
jgi:hypothetical protein